jgi:TolA-binding protein
VLEPDPVRLEALARKGGRELASEADAELKAARKKDGLARAHALEGFVARYSRHPQADAALLEASDAYAEAGKPEAACTVARRAIAEYPAGPVLGEALVTVAACEAQKGAGDGERRILARVVTDFPGTPAAKKASERLAVITGRPGEASPAVPARSGP